MIGRVTAGTSGAANRGGPLQGECCCDAFHCGCARLFMRRRGQPMPSPCCVCVRKAVFAGPLQSRRGGTSPGMRRSGVSVAFERENPIRPLPAGQETAKLTADIRQRPRTKRRVVPVVRSPSRKTVSASSRRVRAPANTQQGPERPRKAKSGSATHARRRRARTTSERLREPGRKPI